MKLGKFKIPLIIFGIIIILGSIMTAYSLSKEEILPYRFVVAEKSDISQDVSVTGKVISSNQVELAFEKSGKIGAVNVEVGDDVYLGQVLARVSNPILSAQIAQANANLQAELARLAELERGTRPEEIQLAETKVFNANKNLLEARKNLENVKSKAETDLDNSYITTLVTAQKAVGVGKNAIVFIANIQSTYYGSSNDLVVLELEDFQSKALQSLLGTSAGGWLSEFISPLTGGAYGEVQNAIDTQDRVDIEDSSVRAIAALQDVLKAVEKIKVTSSFSASDKSSVESAKTSVTTEIYNLTLAQQSIVVQKATNTNSILTARMAISTAENTLAIEKDNLNIKKSGSSIEQINAQKANVNASRANIQNLQAQYTKDIIISPIKGLVTKVGIEKGEIVTANSPIITLISETKFEIEANIPEVDISSVALGNISNVTLDAYGNDAHFDAIVSFIDPAETVFEGVATYRTTFDFIEEDERIRSGMTANIDIVNKTKENVIAIPQRAVIRRSGDKYVRVLQGEMIVEVAVETGIRGVDGSIEIVSGLKEGQKVIVFIEE
ncbi:MAG: efflux RND transporter periplasmic adaptor subunit [Candidatus Magasanikbacteria bacterium]|nr:efflux RND transporter periplasmic adaptor subunit [Candidatus Magasanikbacteria bacterium]